MEKMIRLEVEVELMEVRECGSHGCLAYRKYNFYQGQVLEIGTIPHDIQEVMIYMIESAYVINMKYRQIGMITRCPRKAGT